MKSPLWTKEKIEALDFDSVERLLDRAIKLDNTEVAVLCNNEIESRNMIASQNSRGKSSKTRQKKYDDFLFTWKPDGWPYAELRKLIDEFEINPDVQADWRCYAHKMIYPGARAYFFKQGDKPNRGIFGTGIVTGASRISSVTKKGQNSYIVPIKFTILVDPTKKYLVTEAELYPIAPDETVWDTQASGVGLDHNLAQSIDLLVESRTARQE